MNRLGTLALLALVTACGAGVSTSGVGMPLTPIRPEDRVLLGDFSRVNAVATAFDRLYVAYPTALGIYRTLDRRWEVPRAPREPRLLTNVIGAIVDGVDRSVWLATTDGWLHYRPEADQWDRGFVPGRVQRVAIDAIDPSRGIWFQSSTGWYVQARMGGGASPASPPATLRFAPSVEDAMGDVPQLRAFAPTITIGPRMIPGRITSAAPATDNSGWFLGTSNRGLLFFSRMGAQAESFQLGLPSEVVGAIAAADDGVWVATDATSEVGAQLTWLSADLSRAEYLRGLPTTGLPFDAARRLLIGDQALWVGSDRGLVRIALPGGTMRRFDEGGGLPDQRVTSLVQRRGKVVIGTMRGLAQENAEGGVDRLAPEYFGSVYALVARGDTVWAATAGGLAAHVLGENTLKVPDGLRQLIGGNSATYGVGYVADTLVAMTADRLLWRDPVTGAWTFGPSLSTQLGRLMLMTADVDGAWVAGDRGVALVRPTLGALRVLQVPVDIPDIVTSIARAGKYLWIGTQRGLVRYLLDVR